MDITLVIDEGRPLQCSQSITNLVRNDRLLLSAADLYIYPSAEVAVSFHLLRVPFLSSFDLHNPGRAARRLLAQIDQPNNH